MKRDRFLYYFAVPFLAVWFSHAEHWHWRWSRMVSYPAPFLTPLANAEDRRDWQRVADATLKR